MVLTFFNACQQDELEVDPAGETVLQEKPDIYLEEDYLVFKNSEIVENTLNGLNDQSFEAKQQWEKQFSFKSAMTYRNEASNKLEAMENLATAEKFISELVSKGYFSMQDSCLSYPFFNISWESVLSPTGLVKIGDVLYCFKKDKEIMVRDGNKSTLTRYLNHKEVDNETVKVFGFLKTKSSPTNFGNLGHVEGRRDLNYYHRLLVSFLYERIIVSDPIAGGDIQKGLRYNINYHSYRRQNWWWIDYNTYFSFRNPDWNIGGNFDYIQDEYYSVVRPTPQYEWKQINSSKSANVNTIIYQADFKPSTWLNPQYDTYVGPSINSFQIEVKNNKVDTMPLFDMSKLNIQ